MSVLVGKQAPDFTVPAVLGDGQIVDAFSFSEATKGKYAVLVFYPLDFTFVCPSELIALDHRIDEFKSRNVEVIAVSIDSHFTDRHGMFSICVCRLALPEREGMHNKRLQTIFRYKRKQSM